VSYVAKRRSRRNKYFNKDCCRRREIERHAIYVGAGNTDDLDVWLIAWARHNRHSQDPIGAVMECARRLGRKGMSESEAKAIIAEAAAMPKEMLTADKLAQRIGLTYAVRQKLGITTIGACDVSKRRRKMLRKKKDLLAKEQKRQQRGAKSHQNSLSKRQPWKDQKMSRAKWYRLGKPGTYETNETERSPAVFLNAGAESVSRQSTAPSLATALPVGRAHSGAVQDGHSVAVLPRESVMSLSVADGESHRHGQPPAVDVPVSTLDSSTKELLDAHERLPVDLHCTRLDYNGHEASRLLKKLGR